MAEQRVGAAAADLALLDGDEREVRLSDYWRGAPVVSIFLRHFG